MLESEYQPALVEVLVPLAPGWPYQSMKYVRCNMDVEPRQERLTPEILILGDVFVR
jgi:hypothetical protein